MMIAVCGRNMVALEDLDQYTLKRPDDAGGVWQGIRHDELVETIIEQCEGRGWKVKDSRFAVAREGADLVGAIDLVIPSIDMGGEMGLAIGISHSNARRKALKLTAGATVFCCENGLCTGDIICKDRHTMGLDLASKIREGLKEYKRTVRDIPAYIAAMQEFDLDDEDAEHLILEAGRHELMPWSRLGDVDKEFNHPSFKDHGRGTMWTLYNAFTYVAKRNPPMQQMVQINGFNKMVTEHMGYVTAV